MTEIVVGEFCGGRGELLSIARMAGRPSLSAAVEQASTSYNRPKLRIAEIRTAGVRFGHQRLREGQYTAGRIDTGQAAAIEADFTGWLRENIDKLPVARERIEEIPKRRQR